MHLSFDRRIGVRHKIVKARSPRRLCLRIQSSRDGHVAGLRRRPKYTHDVRQGNAAHLRRHLRVRIAGDLFHGPLRVHRATQHLGTQIVQHHVAIRQPIVRRNVIHLRVDRLGMNLQDSAIHRPIHRQRIEHCAPCHLPERNCPRCVHHSRRHRGLVQNRAQLLAIENDVVVPMHIGVVVVVKRSRERYH